jgi:hypothetical protein
MDINKLLEIYCDSPQKTHVGILVHVRPGYQILAMSVCSQRLISDIP